MADKEAATKVDLGLLEEDDEFEEFPADGENGAHNTNTDQEDEKSASKRVLH